MNLPDLGTAGGAMLGGLGVALGFVLSSMRKVSRHGVGMANDEAEKGMLSNALTRATAAEMESARDRENRTADARQIASLEAENKFLTREQLRLIHKCDAQARLLSAKDRAEIDTNFAQLDERP